VATAARVHFSCQLRIGKRAVMRISVLFLGDQRFDLLDVALLTIKDLPAASLPHPLSPICLHRVTHACAVREWKVAGMLMSCSLRSEVFQSAQ